MVVEWLPQDEYRLKKLTAVDPEAPDPPLLLLAWFTSVDVVEFEGVVEIETCDCGGGEVGLI